ncbi:MAG TPA: nucleotide sugar dehydrogenase, partial [Acetobacteraceae bacterium]|nr:nucleotide sugar dehydrogenase [Acetobacteraceae bacterium]
MDIAVIGLGKLGAPLAVVLASTGHRVIGVDVNPAFVEAINAGRAPVQEPGLQECLSAARSRISATTHFAEAIPATDLSCVIVPTPSGADGVFTNRWVLDAVRHIGTALRHTDRYHVVNITSTVMPGSTGGEIRAALEQSSGRRVGDTVGLTYNPEFIALGTVVRDLLHPDVVLIGESDPRAGDVLEAAYRVTVGPNVPVQRMNWVNAELTKISVNTFVTTKISYANMLAELCEKLPGADVDVVTAALGKDSRIGPKYLRGALGYGGPCFPRDNVAWAALARSVGAVADVAEATDAINHRQVERIVSLVSRLAAPESAIAVLGLAYKPDTPVVEQSQGMMIARRLAETSYRVLVCDPIALESAAAVLGDLVVPMGSAEAAVEEADLV